MEFGVPEYKVSTMGPEKSDKFPSQDHIKAVMFNTGTNHEIRSFLHEVSKSNQADELAAELQGVGLHITDLSRAPEEIVDPLRKLMNEKNFKERNAARAEFKEFMKDHPLKEED